MRRCELEAQVLGYSHADGDAQLARVIVRIAMTAARGFGAVGFAGIRPGDQHRREATWLASRP